MNKELIEMLSLLSSNMDKGFTELNNRIDTVDSKIDSLEKKVDTLEETVDSLEEKFDTLEEKFDTLEKKVDTGFSSTKEILHGIGKKFEQVNEQKEASVDEIKQDLKFVTHKLNSVERDVFNLSARQ